MTEDGYSQRDSEEAFNSLQQAQNKLRERMQELEEQIDNLKKERDILKQKVCDLEWEQRTGQLLAIEEVARNFLDELDSVLKEKKEDDQRFQSRVETAMQRVVDVLFSTEQNRDDDQELYEEGNIAEEEGRYDLDLKNDGEPTEEELAHGIKDEIDEDIPF